MTASSIDEDDGNNIAIISEMTDLAIMTRDQIMMAALRTEESSDQDC